nr:magnesium transporter [Candidatus Undinarchaeales archaeon ERR594346 U_76725]
MKFLLSFIYENTKELKESSAALFLSIFASAVAGAFLSSSKEMLLIIPGLIILVPGATNMRGAIFGAVGARLGSAFHLGQIKSFGLKNDVVKTNVLSSAYLSIIFPVILASLASLFSTVLGLEGATISTFITIAFMGSIFAGSILLLVTFFIAFTAYGRGWDPDNVTSPLIASIGDIITLPSLLAAAWLTLRFSNFSDYFSLGVIGLLIILIITIILGKDSKTRVIVVQSSAVLLSSTVVSFFCTLHTSFYFFHS